MIKRNWRLLTYNLILELSNELEIDPAEILKDYGFSDREMKYFNKWRNKYEICRY